MFNLGQDRIVSATVKQGLNRDQIFHQIRDGRQHGLEFWCPEDAPCFEVLGDQHPSPVNEGSIEGPVRMHRLVLVGWNEVFARVQRFSLTVKIDSKRRRLRRSRRGKLRQGWRQWASAFNEMNAPARVDPRMCNGTCRATASTHAKDPTSVRTTTGQTSHGQHAGPVRAGGADLIPLEPEGVYAQQGMGIVDAVPITDEMLQRRGEAQPSPFLGMK